MAASLPQCRWLMRCLRFAANHSASLRVLLATVGLFLATLPAFGKQTPSLQQEGRLLISVRDPSGRPLSGATVQLQRQGETKGPVSRTNRHGVCGFTALRLGTYTARVAMEGFLAASSGPFVVQAGTRESIQFNLSPSPAAKSSSGTLEFFDEPQFTIAGVTDSTGLGGHGSNTTAPTKQELARQVVALGGSPPAPPGASSSTEEQNLREVAKRQPSDFDANRRFGELLLEQGRAREALPYLQQAIRVKPGDYQSSYDLARAYGDAGEYDLAQTQVQSLLARNDRAELHHFSGDVQEKRGKPLEAAQQYQRAAKLEPSEANFFDWGAELLVHGAAEPAIEVFRQGDRLFPKSLRMLLGLGTALFASGSYEQAARYVCEASDLAPGDPRPYLFLGRMEIARAAPLAGVLKRLARYARLRPDDAHANYYYALGLWKQHQNTGSSSAQVESLLQKAVSLDPHFGEAYLKLGIWYSEDKQYAPAISSWQKALAAEPRLADAHYRLAQAYMRAGNKLKAQSELQVYDQLLKEQGQETETERQHMQQFVYTLRRKSSASPPVN